MHTSINTLSATSPAPWNDEAYHADDTHPRLPKEKGAAGQRRLGLHYASVLAASPLESAQLLAEKLRGCLPNHRCGSGACPPCTWATNRWFRKTAAAFAETTTVMLFSTVQLPDWEAMPTYLEELNVAQQKGLLADALEMAGLGRAPVFGALDVSLNIWPASGFQCWSAHWALYTPDRDSVAFTAAITSVLPRNTSVRVPVKTKVITHTPDKAYSYGFKNVFDKKLMTLAKCGRGSASIIRPGEPELDNLAVTLDHIGIMERFFTQACRFTGDAIVLTS